MESKKLLLLATLLLLLGSSGCAWFYGKVREVQKPLKKTVQVAGKTTEEILEVAKELRAMMTKLSAFLDELLFWLKTVVLPSVGAVLVAWADMWRRKSKWKKKALNGGGHAEAKPAG